MGLAMHRDPKEIFTKYQAIIAKRYPDTMVGSIRTINPSRYILEIL